MNSEKKSFEDALEELRGVVEKLESGNLSLDESLEVFENGIELISFCRKKLNEVEKRVEILAEDEDGEIVRREFDQES